MGFYKLSSSLSPCILVLICEKSLQPLLFAAPQESIMSVPMAVHPDQPFREPQRISDNSAAKKCALIPFFCINSDHSNGWVSLFSHRMLAHKNLHMAQEACLGFRGTSNVRVLWSSRCSVFLSCLPGDLPQAQNSRFVDVFLFFSACQGHLVIDGSRKLLPFLCRREQCLKLKTIPNMSTDIFRYFFPLLGW